jgi:Cys-rich protein (TIGR01571 family)
VTFGQIAEKLPKVSPHFLAPCVRCMACWRRRGIGCTPKRCASHPLPASVRHVLSTRNVSDFAPVCPQGAFFGPVAGSCPLGGLLFCAPTLITCVALGAMYGTAKFVVLGNSWYLVETCGMTGKGAKTCYDFTNGFVTWFPPMLSLLSGCLLRGAVKKTHGIKPNVVEDVVCVLCCAPCVLCQGKREVDTRPPASVPAVQAPYAGPNG